jgi:polar amino acid transport system substrate-binding protein
MKKAGFGLILFAIITVLTVSALTVPSEAATLDEIKARGKFIMLTDPGYFPFEMIDEKGDVTGFDVDIAKIIAEKIGVKLEILPTQWDGIVASLQTRKGDAIISGMTITEERGKAVLFSEPYFRTGLGLLVSEKHRGIKSWSDLDVKGRKIGVFLGNASDFYSEKFFKNVEIVKFTNDSATMAMAVANGQVDAVIHDEPWVIVYAKKNPKGLFAFVSEKHAEEPLGIAVHSGDNDLKELIDSTLKELIASPKYKKLYDYWFVDMPWFK